MTLVHPRIAGLLGSSICHLGLYQVSARVCGPSPARGLRVLQHWGRRTCAWLRLDVQLLGKPSRQPCVYVCNHRSYVDIPLLAGVLGASFMSRADIGTWPVIGTAARAVDVVFIERDDLYGRVAAARALRRRVTAASVVVFPEGTTCGGGLPGVFHPGLFRLLHRMDIASVPVTIRYSDRRAYWVEDITMSEHMSRLLYGPRIEVAIHVGERLAPRAYPNPAALGDAVYRSVCRPIEESGEMVSR